MERFRLEIHCEPLSKRISNLNLSISLLIFQDQVTRKPGPPSKLAGDFSDAYFKHAKSECVNRIQIFPKIQISPNQILLPQQMLQSDLIDQPQLTEPNKSKKKNKNSNKNANGHFRNYYHDAHFGHQ